MARIRLIKPSFFTDDELAELPPLTRLLYIGLWTIADRAGRLKDRPRRIKAECLPYDDCDVDAMLNDLAHRQFIVRYEHSGEHYIAIPSWSKHQHPHPREPESAIPEPPICRENAEAAAEHGQGNVQAMPRQCLGRAQALLSRADTDTDTDTVPPPIIPPHGGEPVDNSDDGFSVYWDAYPVRVGKARARQRWRRLSVTDRRAAVRAARRLAANMRRVGKPDVEHCWHGDTFIGPQELWREWADEVPLRYRGTTAAQPPPACEPTAWHGQAQRCDRCGAPLADDPDRECMMTADGAVWVCGRCAHAKGDAA